jgi:hypothetical protein
MSDPQPCTDSCCNKDGKFLPFRPFVAEYAMSGDTLRDPCRALKIIRATSMESAWEIARKNAASILSPLRLLSVREAVSEVTEE